MAAHVKQRVDCVFPTGWLYGECDGQVGSFPSELVIPIATQGIGPPSYKAIEVCKFTLEITH